MNDSDPVKILLESLTPEQRQQLIRGLMASNAPKGLTSEEKILNEEKVIVNEDFTVSRVNEPTNRKVPVRAKKNRWVDEGFDRDPDFDPVKFEKMGRTARSRSKPEKVDVTCHICGRSFNMNPNLIYGENIRCNRCTGR
jgi:hypothetical protein